MNTTQMEGVRRLRESGLSYKAIHTATGLSEGTIKAYCSRNHITAHEPLAPAVCEHCGKDITTRLETRHRRFCSQQCRQLWWAQNRDKRLKKGAVNTCAYCKKKYSSYAKGSKYCSHPCYIAQRFGRGEERR